MSEYEVETEKKKFKKKSEETPKYDARSIQARKYIIGGAAIFIPDLCKDLRDDWYPEATDEDFKNNIDNIRNEIKHRVTRDWSIDRIGNTDGWAAETFTRLWPDWLTVEYAEAQMSITERQTYQQYRDFMRIVDGKKNKILHDVKSDIPDVPPEPEEPDPMPVEPKEKLLTPKEIYELSMYHIGELWRILGKYKHIPGPDTNIETAVLAHSEKYRLRYLKGMEEGDRTTLVHQIAHLNTFFIGFLRHVKKIVSEETSIEK